MSACVGSERREGVIHVTPVTADIVAVCLNGEFDLANAPALGEEIDLALEGGKDVICDLSEATFIDSSVINILIRGARDAGGRRQELVLQLGTAAVVERVLKIANIEQVVPRAHGREEAVQMIQQECVHAHMVEFSHGA